MSLGVRSRLLVIGFSPDSFLVAHSLLQRDSQQKDLTPAETLNLSDYFEEIIEIIG